MAFDERREQWPVVVTWWLRRAVAAAAMTWRGWQRRVRLVALDMTQQSMRMVANTGT